ncbi:Type IV Pilus-assembly protein W domain-containing protein [Desulfonema limicola]|uniref:Type IV Pilus-assembly protein W domain-containing protein n=1 Tax=Desulfonema limicola TaxID=45656 RepID=A0A975BC60_9BACT|nr:PilW family protein [Desulfonema limicola]QTA82658.1 Type IV Pilus-assembly protein W domain-containing protein [Desulfonema limicola]
MKIYKNTDHGFTLIEIMIALVISSFIIAAIYITFSSQNKSQINQQEMTDVQQNIRAAMYVMASEIRLAGYDISLERGAGTGIVEAGPGFIRFTMDINEDGNIDKDNDDPNEDITFAFKVEDDKNQDGIVDNSKGIATIGRETHGFDSDGNPTTSGRQPLAEGIQAIRFTYFREDGTVIVPVDDGAKFIIDSADLGDVRSIRIAVLGRSETLLDEFDDTNTYDLDGDKDLSGDGTDVDVDINGDGTGDGTIAPFNDKYRRRLLVTTIKCRNLGL